MSGFPAFSKTIAPMAFALWLATSSNAISQTIDVDALRSAAEAGSAQAQLQLGEVLLYGNAGMSADADTALSLLDQAAEAGFVPAKARLGKVLLDGFYTDPDPSRGIGLLKEAAAADNALAQATLGEALLWGHRTEADPARAQNLLQAAAEAGNTNAMRLLGEQLVGGWILERNIPQGLALLEKGVAANDAASEVALGTMLLYGDPLPRDRNRALALFEAAAEKGNGEGLHHYGRDLMWREKDKDAAEAYLIRSAEMGVEAAWTTLSEGAMYGYLGLSQRRKFEGYAERALEEGETHIAVLEAQRRLYGINMRASGPKAIEGLEQAAEAGNDEAAKYLIALVRDGNRYNVRKSPDQAAAYLEKFSELLNANEKDRLAFTIEAAKARGAARFSELAKDFESRPELKSSDFGKEIYAANPNLAIFLLQSRLKEQGIFAGKPDGLAGKATLSALWKACLALPSNKQCYDTVMHPNVIGRLLAL